MALLRRLFRPTREADGAAAALEAVALGVSPALLSAAVELPPPSSTRRDRVADAGQDILQGVLAEKVLHGWLQNRHQTLYPLTVNLRSLDPPQRGVLAGWAALALQADGDVDGEVPPDRLQAALAWLQSVGGDAALLGGVRAALAAPPAMNRTLSALAAHKLSAYGYVVALVALDPRNAATAPFLDYVAARLGLPSTVVRSAARRYRR